jgi:ribonucleoside-diphosphate reductase alpha chain
VIGDRAFHTDPQAIAEQLRGIRCPAPTWNKGSRILSCADAISHVLEKRLKDQQKEILEEPRKEQIVKESVLQVALKSLNMVGVCPECGSPLQHEEGCLKCYGCGYSKC